MAPISALRCNTSESRMFARIFFAPRAPRAQRKHRKEGPPCSPSPRPLRTPVPSGTVLVAARNARSWNVGFGTRCFEQEKTERTEHHWPWSISPFPLLPPVKIHVQVVANQRCQGFHPRWRTKFMKTPVQIVCVVAAGRAVFSAPAREKSVRRTQTRQFLIFASHFVSVFRPR
jgi:hypothetical protein